MKNIIQVARRTNKTAVGFRIQLAIHRMNAQLKDFNNVNLIAKITRHKKCTVTKCAPYIAANGEVIWDDILTFTCTLYQAKTGLYQQKMFQIEVYDTRNDTSIAQFEVDLSNYVLSEKESGREFGTIHTVKCQDPRASLSITVISSRATQRSRGSHSSIDLEGSCRDDISFDGSRSNLSACTYESHASRASSRQISKPNEHPIQHHPVTIVESKKEDIVRNGTATVADNGIECDDVLAGLGTKMKQLAEKVRSSDLTIAKLEETIVEKDRRLQELQVENDHMSMKLQVNASENQNSQSAAINNKRETNMSSASSDEASDSEFSDDRLPKESQQKSIATNYLLHKHYEITPEYITMLEKQRDELESAILVLQKENERLEDLVVELDNRISNPPISCTLRNIQENRSSTSEDSYQDVATNHIGDLEKANEIIIQLKEYQTDLEIKLENAIAAEIQTRANLFSAEMTIKDVRLENRNLFERIKETQKELLNQQSDVQSSVDKKEELEEKLTQIAELTVSCQQLSTEKDNLHSFILELQETIYKNDELHTTELKNCEIKINELNVEILHLKNHTSPPDDDMQEIILDSSHVEPEQYKHEVCKSCEHKEMIIEDIKNQLYKMEVEKDYLQHELIDSKLKLADINGRNEEIAGRYTKMKKILSSYRSGQKEKA